MGKVYLVRHGQTPWNKARIYRGRKDIPLNEQGRSDAACAAQALRKAPLKRVYSSPLSRARETAQAIADQHDLEVREDSAFIDIDYGEWTGHPDTEVRRRFSRQHELWLKSPHLVCFPGGESLDDVRARSVPRLNELANLHRDADIAIVSHRVVLKVLLCGVKGLGNSDFWNVQLDTAAISMVELVGSRLRLVVENDTRHMNSLAGYESEDF